MRRDEDFAGIPNSSRKFGPVQDMIISHSRTPVYGNPMTPTIESARPLSVLIVDDIADAADSLAAVLNLHGYGTRAAHSGEDALQAVAISPPDVVLLDISMPGMDGCELARRVRAVSPRKRPLLVAVTARDQVEDRSRTTEAGIDLHITKPADPAVLVGVLERFRQVIAC